MKHSDDRLPGNVLHRHFFCTFYRVLVLRSFLLGQIKQRRFLGGGSISVEVSNGFSSMTPASSFPRAIKNCRRLLAFLVKCDGFRDIHMMSMH